MLSAALIVVGFGEGRAIAQEGAVGEKDEEKVVPPRRLRVLTIGDAPPFRQEIREGVRHEMEAPPGSLPPYEVVVAAEGVEPIELDLNLKEPSRAVVLPGVAVKARFQSGGALWHQVTVPEGQDYLAILWRDPKVGLWDKARSILVKDDASIAAGKVRFVNISPVEIAVILDAKKFIIKPGQTVVRQIGVTQGIPIQLAYADPASGAWKRYYSSALVQSRGERTTVVTYRADGEKPRSPIKMISMREGIPAPLPKKKEE